MTRWLSKLFNIYPHEWRRVLLLFIIVALPNFGILWGTNIAYTAIIKLVGMEALPQVMMVGAVLSIVTLAIYMAFVDRIADDRLFLSIFVLGAIGIFIGLLLLWLGYSQIAYPLLYLFFIAWATAAGSHLITYISSFYDIQAAKRIIPIVTASGSIGLVFAGLSMSFVTQWLTPELVIIVWLITYLIACATIWFMPYLTGDKQAKERGMQQPTGIGKAEKPGTSFTDSIREGLGYVRSSTYLRWLAISTLLLMIMFSFLEYRSSELFGAKFSQEEFANYIGLLDGISNAVALPVLVFGVSRLIGHLGLGNASLFFPIGNILFCGWLIWAPGVASATGIYLDRRAFRSSMQSPMEALLYNAVPLRIKGRARAFVGGLITPLGSLIGGLLLSLPLVQTSWFIPISISLLAITYLISMLVIRYQYGQALVKMLEEEDYSFLLSQEVSDLPMADPATLNRLQKKLEESTSHELKVFMTQLISQIGGNQSISILAPAIKTTPEARTRSAMLDVLIASGQRGEKVTELCYTLLADSDGQVRQSAIAALEQLLGASDVKFREHMLELLQDTNLDVRIRSLQTLINSEGFYQSQQAIQALDQLLNNSDPMIRAQGVRVLGMIEQSRAIEELTIYLTDQADQVRLEAALALEKQPQSILNSFKASGPDHANTIVAPAIQLLNDPIERVRQAALVVLSRVDTPVSREAIVNALADPSPQVRATAADMLVQTGKSIIPLVHPKLEASNPQHRKMAALVLSRVTPREFGSLILSSSITGNLITIYRNIGLIDALSSYEQHRSIKILRCALQEQRIRLADEIFYLLSAIHEPGAVKIIGDSLHSSTSHIRANAAEALESLTTPQIARLIIPLFEPDIPTEQLIALSKEAWEMKHPNSNQALRQLATNTEDSWLRALTTFSLGEIGMEMKVSGQTFSPPKPSEEPSRPRRRTDTAKLFDAISADAGGISTVQSPSPEPSPTPPSVSSVETYTLEEIQRFIETAQNDPVEEVRLSARAALRKLTETIVNRVNMEESMLSTIDRIIFLKEVPFFRDMTIDQLKVLASVCEEKLFDKGTRIFNNDDPGGVLYVVVSGKVGIEQEKRAGSFARLADIDAYSYFGEVNFFDSSPRSTSAVATQDTLTLQLRREPLIELARQNPEMSLQLINVLSQRLREVNDRLADMTRSKPRSLHQLYDQFD